MASQASLGFRVFFGRITGLKKTKRTPSFFRVAFFGDNPKQCEAEEAFCDSLHDSTPNDRWLKLADRHLVAFSSWEVHVCRKSWLDGALLTECPEIQRGDAARQACRPTSAHARRTDATIGIDLPRQHSPASFTLFGLASGD